MGKNGRNNGGFNLLLPSDPQHCEGVVLDGQPPALTLSLNPRT